MNLVQQGRRRRLKSSNLAGRALLPTFSCAILTTKVRIDLGYNILVPEKIRLNTVNRPANMLSRRDIFINRFLTNTLSRYLQGRQVSHALAIRISQQLTILNAHRLQRVKQRILSLFTNNLLRVLKLKGRHRHRGMKMTKEVLNIRARASDNIRLNTLSLIMVNQERNKKVSRRQTVQHVFNPHVRRLNTILSVRNSALNTSTIAFFSYITIALLRRRMKTIKRNRQNFRKSNQLLTRLTLNNCTNGLVHHLKEKQLQKITLKVKQIQTADRQSTRSRQTNGNCNFNRNERDARNAPRCQWALVFDLSEW